MVRGCFSVLTVSICIVLFPSVPVALGYSNIVSCLMDSELSLAATAIAFSNTLILLR